MVKPAFSLSTSSSRSTSTSIEASKHRSTGTPQHHSHRGRSVNGRRVKAQLKRRIDRASISRISQYRIPVSFGSGLMAPEAEFNRGLSAIERRFNAIRKSQGTVSRLCRLRNLRFFILLYSFDLVIPRNFPRNSYLLFAEIVRLFALLCPILTLRNLGIIHKKGNCYRDYYNVHV